MGKKPNSRILDIGCASGEIARYLSEHKQCQDVGIESDPLLAERARKYCQNVIVGDIETEEVLSRIPGSFDVIILADILEHLKYPEKILEFLRERLQEGGHIPASFPNVANWKIRWKLFIGKFDYTETGILDKSHLKFFTLKTGRQMFQNLGFQIERMEITAGKGRAIHGFLARLFPGLFAYQFIFKVSIRVTVQPSQK